MSSVAPIALFAYNRLQHTIRTVEALQQNDLAKMSDLIAFSDGARSSEDENQVSAVRDYLRSITGFRSVQISEQPKNLGLARSIITGVSGVCQSHGRVIVIEDDLVTSPYFLRYMNDGLTMYENVDEVASIHGYIYPVQAILPETFFLKGADCWGWATWARAWEGFNSDGVALLHELEARALTKEFDFNGSAGYTEMLKDQIAGKNDSWAIRWYASAFLNNQLTLYPGTSLVQNIGHDGSGQHCGISSSFEVPLRNSPIRLQPLPAIEDRDARRLVEEYLGSLKRPSMKQKLFSLFGFNKTS
jgi:hypothetical protein